MNTLVNRSSVTSQNLDLWLVIVVAILCSIGFLAIASASIDYAESRYGWRWYHASKHAAYLLIAIIGACVAYRVPTKLWNLSSWIWLLLAVALLLLVLVPGVGREVNGAQRWIPLGPINLQPSETGVTMAVLAAQKVAAQKTASQGLILRVHDVLETVQALTIWQSVNKFKEES